jgi:hypothetical protein
MISCAPRCSVAWVDTLAAVVALVALVAGCDGVDDNPGLEAWLRVDGATFVEGSLPSPSGGPAVASLEAATKVIRPGMVGKAFTGALGESATSVGLALAGDRGHWIVVAGVPNVATPDFPSFDVTSSMSPELPLGDHALIAAAADAEGRFGEGTILELSAIGGAEVEGELVVSLTWDTDADLDLHVTDPNGIEIYKGNINSVEPPPPGSPPPDPEAWKAGGILDFDSNASCLIDGRRQENVVWANAPPAGGYIVRVDTFSMCGQAVARWEVVAIHRGEVIGRAKGTSLPIDAAAPHQLGAGVLALELTVP